MTVLVPQVDHEEFTALVASPTAKLYYEPAIPQGRSVPFNVSVGVSEGDTSGTDDFKQISVCGLPHQALWR